MMQKGSMLTDTFKGVSWNVYNFYNFILLCDMFYVIEMTIGHLVNREMFMHHVLNDY